MGVVTETFRITGVDKAVRDMEALAKAAEETKAKFGEIPRIEMPSSFEAFKADMDEGAAATQRLSGSMGSLAQQMPDVITQLASGGNVLQVFTQQGLQVVQANQALLASLTALGPGLAALAGAATMLGGAYFRLNEASIEQAQAQDVVAAASANLVNWSDTLRTAEIDLAEATGRLTEAEAARARLAITTQGLWLQSTEELRAKQMELRREQESVTTQVVDMATKFLGVVDVTGAWSAVLDMTTDSSEDIQRSLDAVNVALGQQTEEARKTTDALEKASTAKINAAKASETHKKALDEEAASLQAIIDMEDKFAAEERKRAEEQAKAQQESMDALIAQEDKFAEIDRRNAEAAMAAEAAPAPGSTTASALLGQSVSAVSGGLAQIAAMVNPIVGAIAAAFLNLDNIVQGLKQQLAELPAQLVASPDLLAGLVVAAAQAMPALMEALPDVVSELITALLAPETIAALAKIAIEGLLLTFGADPRLYIGILNGLIDAIPQLVQAWIDALKNLPQELITGRREMRQRWGGLGDRFGGGGLNLQVNGMVGDSWRLGNGIRSLFDRDFGRTGGRF